MRAMLFEQFGQLPELSQVQDPTPRPHGAVIKVAACGLCRSDWHGWMGHDADIQLPHVPGHEFAGVIAEVGTQVKHWQVGDRVTVPFICACGTCQQCASGNQQVCDDQFQPGFTGWGAFAEYVGIAHADTNLVALPEDMTFTTAASLGCRFATAYRAVVYQGQLKPGQWCAVFGCGGVGLSAVMIAAALGARVIAVDVNEQVLSQARQLGAELALNASGTDDVPAQIHSATNGGVQVSLDALGSAQTCVQSIQSLAKRGKHIQVGLMLAEHQTPPIPMDIVVANELEIIGSHGMQAHRYNEMFALIAAGKVAPQKLVTEQIALAQSGEALAQMPQFAHVGMTLITEF